MKSRVDAIPTGMRPACDHSRGFHGLFLPKVDDDNTGNDACSISFRMVLTCSSDLARLLSEFVVGRPVS